MCHDMTGLAIMAGRLGARTFCLPWTDRLATRFLGRCSGTNQVRSVHSSSDGGWTIPKQQKNTYLAGPIILAELR